MGLYLWLKEKIKNTNPQALIFMGGYLATSAADELKKFKELLDTGIITQEEFDSKKKELLGI